MGEPRTAASVRACSRLTTRTSMGRVPRLRRVQTTDAGPRTPKSLGYPADQFSDDSLLPPDLQERIASGDLFFPTASEACSFQASGAAGGTRLGRLAKGSEASQTEGNLREQMGFGL